MDAVKGRCVRDPCRYFHPPLHLQAHLKAQARGAVRHQAARSRSLTFFRLVSLAATPLPLTGLLLFCSRPLAPRFRRTHALLIFYFYLSHNHLVPSFRCILCIYNIVTVSVPSCDASLHVDGRRSAAAGSERDFGAGQETSGACRARAATGIAASFARFCSTPAPARTIPPRASPSCGWKRGAARSATPARRAAPRQSARCPSVPEHSAQPSVSRFRWT